MDNFAYSLGYRHAAADISVEGIEYADRHAGNLSDSDYTTGYRTAVNLAKERRSV